MRARSRRHVVIGSVLWCLLFLVPFTPGAGEPWLGRVLYSHGTTLRGVPVLGLQTVLSGDVLTTSDEGSALVELNSGAKVRLVEHSSVRFVSDGTAAQAELLAGTAVSESSGKPTTVVTTPQYTFGPAQEGECRYAVQFSKERATVAGAMQGNLLITPRSTTGSYVLEQGKYAAISASAMGVPSQAGEGPNGAQRAGTVKTIIPDDIVQRGPQSKEIALKEEDLLFWGDVVRTSANGRLRIALLDGSSLNLGSNSTLRIIRHNPEMQRTQIELTGGEMHVWVAKLTQDYASFKVQTLTAALSVVGTDFIVEAQVNTTKIYCVEGMVTVQNIDEKVPGQVVLHAGQQTSVAPFLPAAPVNTPDALLQSQISRTTVGAAAAAGVEAPSAAPGTTTKSASAKPGWHIGSLSEGASIGIIVGAAGGAAAAAIAGSMSKGGSASPSAP